MQEVTVLLTGAGGPGGPGIIQSLRLARDKKMRIVATDMDRQSVASGLADAFYVVPKALDDSFIPTILDIAKKESVQVILLLNTAELLKFAEHKKLFEKEGIEVSVSDTQGLTIANDKHLLMEKAKALGVPVPEFYLVKNTDELIAVATKLGYPEKKVCVKPPVSNGSRGFRVLDAKVDPFDIFLNRKPENVETTLEDLVTILKTAKEFHSLLVMEYLPGKEYGVDALANHGKPIVVIPRTRDKMKMGVSFAATLVNHEQIIRDCQQLIEELSLNGNIGFQFKEDAQGVAKLIESNPRLQGTVVVNTAGGANLVEMAVASALGEEVAKPSVRWGTSMIRYWQEQYFNAHGKPFSL